MEIWGACKCVNVSYYHVSLTQPDVFFFFFFNGRIITPISWKKFVGENDMLVGLHVPTKLRNSIMGAIPNPPPPPPSGYARASMCERAERASLYIFCCIFTITINILCIYFVFISKRTYFVKYFSLFCVLFVSFALTKFPVNTFACWLFFMLCVNQLMFVIFLCTFYIQGSLVKQFF